MSEQMAAPAEKRTQGPQTYVVAVQRQFEVVAGWGAEASQDPAASPEPVLEKHMLWQDVATVTVPPRTKRSAVVKQALAEAGITPEPGKPAPRVRVLDEESAFVHEPEAKQPPAEWVV